MFSAVSSFQRHFDLDFEGLPKIWGPLSGCKGSMGIFWGLRIEVAGRGFAPSGAPRISTKVFSGVYSGVRRCRETTFLRGKPPDSEIRLLLPDWIYFRRTPPTL